MAMPLTQIRPELKVVTYNCRGWNSNFVNTLINDYCFDICLIQEHWLLQDHLSALNINPDFTSFGIGGMDSNPLLLGRPFGGCGVLYHKSLSPYIRRLSTYSKRFRAFSFSFNSFTTLFICVYLPTDYGNQDSQDRFAESLNKLRGFIDSQSYDNMIVAGDFNVDSLG